MELTKTMYKMLNDQYNFEVESANIYLAISSFCSANDLPGSAHWFMNQYKEEMIHANMFYNYIQERGEMTVIEGWSTPKSEYEDLMEMLQTSLEHEKIVTSRIRDLMIQARSDNDFACEIFLNWFITEQVEEENNFNDLIGRLRLYPKDQILMYDQELLARATPKEPAV